MTATLDAEIRNALRDVMDPELGRSLLDLGLIYSIETSPDGGVRIAMTTTARGCPLAGFLKDAVEMRVSAVEGVSSVETWLTYDPVWTPAMMANN
ncbi:metal-sulfur cluster assembly factor [Bosea sp. 2YAB26]|jgi:metal-sulfur cluster biosynthetic enzyme|uniref:metal-sulfur cluster assembly factor n=1 Tax=Bosea sp. 2YAB26 TaxID=3237478 RepID=UPI003F8DBC67